MLPEAQSPAAPSPRVPAGPGLRVEMRREPPIGKQREPLIDALRACALLGVVVVNVVSYPFIPFGSPLGAPLPPDSPLALAIIAAVAFLLQGKAYPLLAFLFGYSVVRAMAARGHGRGDAGDVARRRARMKRLLVLGVLHGVLIYAGDVLTIYAVAGLLIIHWARWPLRKLRQIWRLLFAVAIGMVLVNGGATLWALDVPGLEPAASFTSVDGVAAFAALNASAYARTVPALLLTALPEILMLMVAGAIVARLRWLTHPRWHRARSRFVARLLPLGVLLNLAYAAGMSWAVTQAPSWQWVGLSFGPLAGWTLAAALCTTLAQWWHASHPAWMRACVPLGRYTLSLYLATSLLCLLVFSGAGLHVSATTVRLVGFALALWLAAVGVARLVERRGWRSPLESWLSGSRG